MDITTYLKRKMAMLSLALARVEKSSLNQVSDALGSEGAVNETMEQGSMAQNLLRGVVTQEVKELRWRMYKVLNATQDLRTKIVGYDEDGLPITETTKHERQLLRAVNVDDEDPYKVEIVIRNEDVVKSTSEAFGNEKLKVHTQEEIDNFDETNEMFDLHDDSVSYEVDNFGDIIETENDVEEKRTLGQITFDDMVASMKSDKSILVHRSVRPKFEIEQYARKLVVRGVNEDTKLLEFYISKYPDEFDRKTRFLISEIKKIQKNPRSSDMLDIEKVGFITYKTLGAANGMEYIYEIKNFHKVVEFNGHYVIKFMAKPIVNGKFMMEQHKLEELEKKYAEKAPKNLKK